MRTVTESEMVFLFPQELGREIIPVTSVKSYAVKIVPFLRNKERDSNTADYTETIVYSNPIILLV